MAIVEATDDRDNHDDHESLNPYRCFGTATILRYRPSPQDFTGETTLLRLFCLERVAVLVFLWACRFLT